ncbi:MAG: dihydroxyacetone kinase subunit DhaL [Capnocytophaga sp.]|nr:dihydroxyacetone kinase subunit DhaL [Capnocytophaga sp.]
MITNVLITNWLYNCTAILAENKDYLTDLDRAIGDADHGLNMTRGFTKVKEKLETNPSEDIGDIFKNTAFTLISTVGGASGPLYGALFLKASMQSKGKSSLTTSEFANAMEAGVKEIQAKGGASLGDKTMVDLWIPVIEALKKEQDTELASCIDQIISVAEDAKNATIDLIAKKGRASYIGERSKGHLDPGATSSFLLLKALQQTLSE